MILIADSGSTKTDWCLIKNSGKSLYFKSEGYNPYFFAKSAMIESIRSSISVHIDPMEVATLYFYGAGCEADKTGLMIEVLSSVFSNCKQLYADVDLLAAARGLLGQKSGFAAILGTGTNTCIYDGVNIVKNIDSLGFILGDEGSGGAIGKRILSDYLRNKMPSSVRIQFEKQYRFSAEEIIHQVYIEPMPNRFCAQFAKFLNHPEVDADYSYRIVKTSFQQFFENLVSCYPGYTAYSFNCVGSIAYHFKNALLEVLTEFNMKPGLIIPSLIEELVAYHRAK
ncbi:N-acetylglucosamine kinase [Pedobacter panaciterrae]|jgi:Predicted N-acetylglucosamine kinase|uniref:N-acetylglucosamine kinase n=1 Tax=Pedobacter panaciterrae TaxID=363849 RepID=UPI002594E186|nr:N-acetylglucosamine kinase [uncultured Pedobacter sp.]